MRPRLISRVVGNESGSELCVVMSPNGLRGSRLFCQVLNPDGNAEPECGPREQECALPEPRFSTLLAGK